jgi:hypothetical protein
MRVLSMSNSDIELYVNSLEKAAKGIKDEIYRISWYMRGGVSSQDLFHIYSYEDRQLMFDIIKENIEATKTSKMPLI